MNTVYEMTPDMLSLMRSALEDAYYHNVDLFKLRSGNSPDPEYERAKEKVTITKAVLEWLMKLDAVGAPIQLIPPKPSKARSAPKWFVNFLLTYYEPCSFLEGSTSAADIYRTYLAEQPEVVYKRSTILDYTRQLVRDGYFSQRGSRTARAYSLRLKKELEAQAA